jgi:hypothetical protein
MNENKWLYWAVFIYVLGLLLIKQTNLAIFIEHSGKSGGKVSKMAENIQFTAEFSR